MKAKLLVMLIVMMSLLSVSGFVFPVYGAPTDHIIFAPQSTSIADGAIDGTVGLEWADAGEWNVTGLGGGLLPHRMRAKHDGTYLYILLEVTDTNDPYSNPAHDWVGVEFDRNNDGMVHGTTSSPDDWEFCDWVAAGGDDWWSQGFGSTNRFADSSDEVVAARGWNASHTIWEFKRPLNSGDTAGYDIAMDHTQTGVYGKDRIAFALAYQDGATGRHYACSSINNLLILTGPLPTRTLTVQSTPLGASFTANGVPHVTPWTGTFPQGMPVTLEMPQEHAGMRFAQWQEDGDPIRIKTVVVTTDMTWTAVYEPVPAGPAVGGSATPIHVSLSLPAFPSTAMLLALIISLIAATAIVLLVYKRKAP